MIGVRATRHEKHNREPGTSSCHALKDNAEKTLGTKWVFSELHSMTS